jgi:transcriptional regulator with XRE-family HTH domain
VPSTDTLGERVRQLRKAQGLTQQDLATTEIHGSYISLI